MLSQEDNQLLCRVEAGSTMLASFEGIDPKSVDWRQLEPA